MNNNSEQHITFIAGGSKGLGLAIYQQLREAGHTLVEFSRSGDHLGHLDCDFAKPEKAINVFKTAFNEKYDQAGHINLIVNTATLEPFGPIQRAASKDINSHITINVETITHLVRLFARAYQDHPAQKTLSYVSSGAANRAIPGMSMYSASKAYGERLIDTFREEQKEQAMPIQTMIINPGVMDTGMQDTIRAQKKKDFPLRDHWQKLYENNELAEPEQIAAFIIGKINNPEPGYHKAQ